MAKLFGSYAALESGHTDPGVNAKLEVYHEAVKCQKAHWDPYNAATQAAVKAAKKAVKDALKELKSKPVKGKGKA